MPLPEFEGIELEYIGAGHISLAFKEYMQRTGLDRDSAQKAYSLLVNRCARCGRHSKYVVVIGPLEGPTVVDVELCSSCCKSLKVSDLLPRG
jgi:hypothetical protein